MVQLPPRLRRGVPGSAPAAQLGLGWLPTLWGCLGCQRLRCRWRGHRRLAAAAGGPCSCPLACPLRVRSRAWAAPWGRCSPNRFQKLGDLSALIKLDLSSNNWARAAPAPPPDGAPTRAARSNRYVPAHADPTHCLHGLLARRERLAIADLASPVGLHASSWCVAPRLKAAKEWHDRGRLGYAGCRHRRDARRRARHHAF